MPATLPPQDDPFVFPPHALAGEQMTPQVPAESDRAIDVLQYSPGRSGSTMLYHVLQHLGTAVQKTHECLQTEAKVVITYRHPCDVF
ncbi:MAG: hypothetical protein P8K78_09010, partial [Pirellulales bacterium]|nr:hypothetical protein [Pirellulales bacterium]